VFSGAAADRAHCHIFVNQVFREQREHSVHVMGCPVPPRFDRTLLTVCCDACRLRIVDLLPRDSKAELAVQELRTQIGRQPFSFAKGVPSQALVFEAMVEGTILATTAPSNLPNYDPTAESWSS